MSTEAAAFTIAQFEVIANGARFTSNDLPATIEMVLAIETEAVAAKRARIAENIEILRLIDPNEPDHPGPYYDGWHAALNAVLVIVETEP